MLDEHLGGRGILAFSRELTPQWSQTDGNTHFVAMPPPSVNLPRGLHHAPVPSDPQPTVATPTTITTPSTTPTATTTPPATATPTGAQPTSAPPPTPTPPTTTH